MKNDLRMVLVCSLATLFMTTAGYAADNDPGILQREVNQQNRIDQGIRSGQLTPSEAARLEAQQTRIQQREERMTARDNGHLTAQDKAKLTRQQDRASRNIYRKKHNNRMANVGK